MVYLKIDGNILHVPCVYCEFGDVIYYILAYTVLLDMVKTCIMYMCVSCAFRDVSKLMVTLQDKVYCDLEILYSIY